MSGSTPVSEMGVYHNSRNIPSSTVALVWASHSCEVIHIYICTPHASNEDCGYGRRVTAGAFVRGVSGSLARVNLVVFCGLKLSYSG